MAEIDYVIGQSVSVPWGLDVVEGVVVGAYGEGSARRILVDVSVAGDDEPPATLPFPVHVLDEARGSVREKEAGSWLSAYQFALALFAALERVTSSLDPGGLVEQGGQRGDTAYDVAVTTSDSKLIFEAKHLSRVGPSVRRESIFQLQTALSRERGLSDKKLAGILVTSADIPSSLIEYVEEVRRQGFPIWVVRWHPEEGYESLVQPVRTALADAF